MLKKGVLIAVEGVDGAGKTTQANAIAARLRAVGLDVVLTKEPTQGPWGQMIRQSAQDGRLSPDDELEAFIEDRKEHVRDLLQPSLRKGKVVIVDRYYFSTIAYQGARGMDPDNLRWRNEQFAPAPDLLVLLDVDPAVGLARVKQRGDEADLFEKEEDLRKARAIFSELNGPYTLRLDGTRAIEDITAAVLRRLYDGPLFERLCHRADLKACEPAYCSFLHSGVCKYPKMGPLAPIDLSAL